MRWILIFFFAANLNAQSDFEFFEWPVSSNYSALNRARNSLWRPFFYNPNHLDRKSFELKLNGFRLKSDLNEFFSWSRIGGLNELFRNQTLFDPSNLNDLSYGVLQSSFFEPREMKKQSFLQSSLSNRSYLFRIGAYSNQEYEKGNLSFGAQYRGLGSGQVQGAIYDSFNFNLVYQPKKKIWGADLISGFWYTNTQREPQSFLSEEQYSYLGSSSRVNSVQIQNEAIAINFRKESSWSAFLNLKTENKLVGLMFDGFRSSRTYPLYKEIGSPLPLYYRNFPSYHRNQESANYNRIDELHTMWSNRPAYFFNWDFVLAKNSANQESLVILKDQVQDQKRIQGFFSKEISLNKSILISLEFSSIFEQMKVYDEVGHLLGGDYYLDENSFLEPVFFQLNSSKEKFKVGDRVYRNYTLTDFDNRLKFNMRIKHARSEFDFLAFLAYKSFTRKPKFESSYSADPNPINLKRPVYNLQLRWIQKIDIGDFIALKFGSHFNESVLKNNFVNVDFLNTIESPPPFSFHQVSFQYRRDRPHLSGVFELCLYGEINGLSRGSFFMEHDYLNIQDFVSLFLINPLELYSVMSLGFDYKLNEFFEIGIASQLSYELNPKSSTYKVFSPFGEGLVQGELDSRMFNDIPLNLSSLSLAYRSSKGMFINVHLTARYQQEIAVNPFKNSDISKEASWSQEYMPSTYLLGISFNKGFKFFKEYLSIFLSIDNLLGERFASTSIASRRESYQSEDVFANKFWWQDGTRFFLNFKLLI